MKRMLVVEDERQLADAYRAVLADELSLAIDIATDGADALNQAISKQPDLIILDLILPDQDGVDVLKALQKEPKTKHIPVIVASNLDDKEKIAHTLSLGAKDYFIKSNTSILDLVEKCKIYLGDDDQSA